jgi:hypothetical protein
MSKKSRETYVQEPTPAEIWAILFWFLYQMLVWFPCISTQLSVLRHTEVGIVEIPCSTRLSWRAFFTRCCNTSTSLVGAEYAKDFKNLHSQKSRGLRSPDLASQLTGSPHPIHCSPKVWFRCCLKWSDVLSCTNYMCCWWRGKCSKSTGTTLTKKNATMHLLVC